ncbi:hypothetical protein SUGI_1021720 [Cryptomeria japonica]|nr:hypothetical protein SUGI_1021720 [Cryptomeria japonica]
MWVYTYDKAHDPQSNTRPRTEIRILGKDYKSGVWQFEGDGYVPEGANGVCVMQIHGYVGPATVIMLDVVDGNLRRYHDQLVTTDVFDRWFHLNVIHDTDQRKAYVFIDGKETLAVNVSEGVWQFEGEVYVPQGTSGVCVMQVFGGVQHATSFMLLASNGVLIRYNDQVVASEIYDRWIHLNVIHNGDEGKVSVFVDGNEKVLADDRGRANHYFKCGVYAGVNASSCMESRWRNIKLWTK